MKSWRKVVKIFASLKLAVVIIIAIATITAVGTFVESDYNAIVAQKWVYKSIYMYLAMSALVFTLIAVIVDRWPWKKHHAGFIFAHIGIILVLVGALLTQNSGVDGSLRMQVGESQKNVTLGETDLKVYASFDGDSYRSVFAQEVDFFMHSPKQEPLQIPLPGATIEVVDYMPFASSRSKVVASVVATDPPALHFQLENQRVNVANWLVLSQRKPQAEIDLGPAQVVFSRAPLKASGRNEILIWQSRPSNQLHFAIYSKEKKKIKEGEVRAGDTVETGWMGLIFRVIDYFPSAKEETTYNELMRPTSISTSAVKVKFKDQEYWLGLNSMIKLFDNNVGYVVTYQNRLLDLGFALQLEKFEVGRYQGTGRAASYQSLVQVPEQGAKMISMNEPLKYKGYTFYQASFEADEKGQPAASILSVNRDPGRPLKYVGCFLVVLGTIIMFYFKKRAGSGGRSKVVKEVVL